MKIPFLKPGTYSAHNGGEVTFSEADMNKIIEATKNRTYQNDSIPIVIGHPKTDSPAWGWVKKDKIINDKNVLIALADNGDLNETFVDWFKKKLYSTVSASIRKDYSIKHFGILGGTPPAVTGLPAVALSEDSDLLCEVELSEKELAEVITSKWWFLNVAKIFRKIREEKIAKDGVEAADNFITNSQIDDIATPPYAYTNDPVVKSNSFSESEEDLNNSNNKNLQDNKMKKTLEELETELAEANGKITTLEQEKSTLQKEKTDAAVDAKRKEFLAFCESDDVKNKIKDGEKNGIVETLLALNSLEAFEFGEGDNKTTVKPVDIVTALIKRLPDVVELGEKFNNGTASDKSGKQKDEATELAEKIDDMISKEEKAGRKISYAEAAAKVKANKQ